MKKFAENGKKKFSWWPIILALACVLVAGVTFRFYADMNRNAEKPPGGISVEKHILVAKDEIKAGTYADANLFELVPVSEETDSAEGIRDYADLNGKRVLSDMKKGEYLRKSLLINKNIWYEKNDRYMEQTFIEGTLPVNTPHGNLVGELVDIVLFQPDAPDEVVVSKAAIVSANGNRLGFHLDPAERELLREAATEGTLHFDFYLDDSQTARPVTYMQNSMEGSEN